MIKIDDLKRISLLKDTPRHLLEILAKEAQISIFSAETELITINEKVETLFMVTMGQVAIYRELAPDIDVILDYAQAGASFGISAIVEDSVANYTAICQEPCEVISLSGKRMMELFESNHELAYNMMQDVSRQYKQSIDLRAHMLSKLWRNR